MSHARELAELLAPLANHVKVNLIPYNDTGTPGNGVLSAFSRDLMVKRISISSWTTTASRPLLSLYPFFITEQKAIVSVSSRRS
jgi:hypothetical protein